MDDMDEKIVSAVINSKEGFFVGDICYVLSDNVYSKNWGETNKYKDGSFVANGYEYVVAGTKHGDGCYADQWGNGYPVDAGVIGCVSAELCEKIKFGENTDLGIFVKGDRAEYYADDGDFVINIYSNQSLVKSIHINTDWDDEDEDEWDMEDDEEDDLWDEDDDTDWDDEDL